MLVSGLACSTSRVARECASYRGLGGRRHDEADSEERKC